MIFTTLIIVLLILNNALFSYIAYRQKEFIQNMYDELSMKLSCKQFFEFLDEFNQVKRSLKFVNNRAKFAVDLAKENHKRMNQYEEDYIKFGEFISKAILLLESRPANKTEEVKRQSNIESLTRKFWAKAK